MSPHSIIRMCVCVSMAACIAEGRLAPANGRNLDRQDRRAAPVCSFVVPKNGAATLPEERNASKMAAPFLGPACCIHSQPPSACSE